MTNVRGDHIWYELLTSDADAAAAFYGAVVGWRARAFEGSAIGYRLFSIGGTDVGGHMTLPAEAAAVGARPAWLSYIAVDDVDATVAQVMEAGGRQYMPATDVPGVGRIAMLADPQGAPFYVMRGAVEGTSNAFSATEAGHCRWNELTTSDQSAALGFYQGLFGWEKGDAMPMGEMGSYQFLHQGGQMIGAVMTGRPGGPRPAWTYYFGVTDIDRAAATTTERGGMIHMGPMEIPGGEFAIVASDPQGAVFGLVGPRKS